MADRFESHSSGLDSPASDAFAVTPHATNPLTTVTRGIYVGGAGDVVVRLVNATADVTFSAVAAGTILPIRASHVRATSSATLMIGLA